MTEHDVTRILQSCKYQPTSIVRRDDAYIVYLPDRKGWTQATMYRRLDGSGLLPVGFGRECGTYFIKVKEERESHD